MPRGNGPKRTATKRKSPKRTGPAADVKDLLKARNDGGCEIGVKCAGQAAGVDPAHRQGKKGGGTNQPWSNLASNLLWACRNCHDEIDNVSPADAERHGFKVREGVALPQEIPVKHYEHGWMVLDDDGGWQSAPSAAWNRGVEALLPVIRVQVEGIDHPDIPYSVLERYKHHLCGGYEWDEQWVITCKCGPDLFVAVAV